MRKRVLVINTGGTIGMERTDAGYRPRASRLARQMQLIPELADPAMPEYEIAEYDPVLDSSNLTPARWLRIAEDIQRRYDEFDAFVVLHGTDTMAYTASALAMMLRGLSKTVILTGSQLPLGERRNDARGNLITSLILSSDYCIPEVAVFFGSRLLRGCRTTKISTGSFDAFDSPNEPPLGTAGTHLRVFQHRIRRPESGAALCVEPIEAMPIATFRLFPGVAAGVLDNLLQPPLRGLLLESYGAGNGPSRDRGFLNVLAEAVERGIVIVNLSQCMQGGVHMTEYATGKALADAGVISGGDMTVEAAVAKLMYLFTRELSVGEIRDAMSRNLFGEMTDPDDEGGYSTRRSQ